MVLFINKHNNHIVGTQSGMKKTVLVTPGGLTEDDIIWHIVEDKSIPKEIDSLLNYRFEGGQYTKIDNE